MNYIEMEKTIQNNGGVIIRFGKAVTGCKYKYKIFKQTTFPGTWESMDKDMREQGYIGCSLISITQPFESRKLGQLSSDDYNIVLCDYQIKGGPCKQYWIPGNDSNTALALLEIQKKINK